LIWVKGVWERHITFLNEAKAYVHQQLYELHVKDSRYIIPLAAYLNSTLKMLFSELWGRVNFGQGVLWIATYEAATHPVIDLRKIDEATLSKIMTLFNRMLQRPIGSVFVEILGTDLSDNEIRETPIEEIVSRVSLNKVKPDRLELDNVFFDILGLTMEERIEVYKAVIELVASRIKKALSVKKGGKNDVIDTSKLAESIIKRINFNKRFPEDYIMNYKGPWIEELKLPKGSNVVLNTDLRGFYIKVDEKEVYRNWKSHMVKYVYYSLIFGNNVVKIPKDEDMVRKAVEAFENDLKKLKQEIDELLNRTIPNAKIRSEVKSIIWRKLFKESKG